MHACRLLSLGLWLALAGWASAQNPPAPAYTYPAPAAETDTLGSLRELAALASFDYSVRQTQRGEPTFLPAPLAALTKAPYTPEYSALLIRMSRLAALSDAGVAEIARDFRPLMVGCYQLNVMNARYGNTRANSASRFSDLMDSTMSYLNSDSHDRRGTEDKVIYGDKVYIIPGREYVSSAQTQQQFSQMTDNMASLKSDLGDLERYSRMVNVARISFHEKASALWEQKLFPKLEATVPATAREARLVEVAQVQKFEAPRALRQFWQYGLIAFGNPPVRLTNVIARVRLKNEFGERGDWYAYLPALQPQQYVQIELPYPLALLSPLSLKVEAEFTLLCDQGRMTGIPVDTGEKTNNGRSIEEIRDGIRDLQHDAEKLTRVLPNTVPVAEDPRASGQALAAAFGEGKLFVTQLGKTSYLVKAAPFTLRARDVLVSMSTIVDGEQRVTELACRLMTEVDRGIVLGCARTIRHIVTYPDGRREIVPVQLTELPEDSPAVPQRAATASAPTAPPANRPPLGSSSSLRTSSLTGPSRLPSRFPGSAPGGSNASSSAEPKRDPRPTRVVTSPSEILDSIWYRTATTEESIATNPMMMMLTGNIKMRDAGLALHSTEPTRDAEYVFYVDPKGEPWIQVVPLGEAKVRHFRLYPAVEKAPAEGR